MGVYFSSSKLCFIPSEWKDDGTYTDDSWPSDAVLLTDDEELTYWKVLPPNDMQIGSSESGRPVWVRIEEPRVTYAQELSKLNETYQVERLSLCSAWLVAAVADGITEAERKKDVEEELLALDNQHELDMSDLKKKHGVE